MWAELAYSFQSGNLYIYTILLIAFCATVVIFERLIMLQFVYYIDFPKFLNNLKRMISAEDNDRAMNLCRSVSHTSLPRIALRALEAAETDPTTIRGTLEEETIQFLPRIESRIAALPGLATLILLIGVLGTIDALWAAFHSVDVLDTAKKQASVAHNVASSLSPTAMGLLVCMLLLWAHQIIRSLAVRLTERIHHGIAVLTNLLVPAEVATFMPVAHAEAAPAPSFDSPAVEAPAAEAASQGVQSDDAFDDASVEDIKDEEEII